MTSFRVWAPKAREVELDLGGRPTRMAPAARGWYEVDVAEAEAAAEAAAGYGFRLDGGPTRPDPRSPSQPEGVHGLSRLVDHDAFPWTDEGWLGFHLPSAVIYELHVGTFSPEGTFDGAILALDHVVELGVTAVEVMPVAEFSGPHGWGYDGVDLWAVHSHYGGPDGFKRLVDACHARGLGVLLDVVYNHFGPEGNHLLEFGPYLTSFYSTPWGAAVNYDRGGSDEVRRFAVDNALMWLRDFHVDGLRLDAVHAIVDTSAVHLLEQLAAEVDELAAVTGRARYLVAESDLNDPRLVRSREAGGYGLDAQWSDDFHHALHAVATGETGGYYEDFGAMGDLAEALSSAFVYAGRWSVHRDRRHGRPATGVPGWRFLGYAQNHDQVGNRAGGDRLSASLTPARLKVVAALHLCAPFVPMIFQGEEWGSTSPFLYFTSHEDPELGRAVSAGRRAEFAAFGWDAASVPDPQDPVSFERSKLDWEEAERGHHADLLEWYRALIALRRRTPDLGDGRLDRVRTRFDEAARWLVVERGGITVAANLGVDEASPPVRPGRVLLASEPSATAGRLPPDSVVILG